MQIDFLFYIRIDSGIKVNTTQTTCVVSLLFPIVHFFPFLKLARSIFHTNQQKTENQAFCDDNDCKTKTIAEVSADALTHHCACDDPLKN